MKKSLLILLFLIPHWVRPCDCSDFTRVYEEHNSQLIFIGEVVGSTEGHYTMRIDELFKNSTSMRDSLVHIVINSCAVAAKEGESWLIYADRIAEKWYASACGYSSNLDFLSKSGSSKIPPPRPLNYTPEEGEMVRKIQEILNFNQLHMEITNIRLKKLQSDIEKLRAPDIDGTPLSDKPIENDVFHIFLICSNIILTVFMIFMVIKSKSLNRRTHTTLH